MSENKIEYMYSATAFNWQGFIQKYNRKLINFCRVIIYNVRDLIELSSATSGDEWRLLDKKIKTVGIKNFFTLPEDSKRTILYFCNSSDKRPSRKSDFLNMIIRSPSGRQFRRTSVDTNILNQTQYYISNRNIIIILIIIPRKVRNTEHPLNMIISAARLVHHIILIVSGRHECVHRISMEINFARLKKNKKKKKTNSKFK